MSVLQLFLTFFKIGAFTFGGGYAMIAVVERELVEKGFVTKEEFLDMTAITESTPGPIAINMATYMGYKFQGFLGSTMATLGVVLPSFIIIFAISLFFEAFQKITFVYRAFKGIQVAVIYLIFSAGLKLMKGMKKTRTNIIICAAVFTIMVALYLISVKISSIYMILICAAIGMVLSLFQKPKEDKK